MKQFSEDDLVRKNKFLTQLDNGGVIPITQEQVVWFEEWCDNNPEFVKKADESLRNMECESILSWMGLCVYLRAQMRANNTQFRLSSTGDRSFSIRPFGNNKEVFEFRV